MLIFAIIGYLLGTYLGVYLKISPLFLLVLVLLIILLFFIYLYEKNIIKKDIRLKIFVMKYLLKLIVIIITILVAILRVQRINNIRDSFLNTDINNRKNNNLLENTYIINILNKEKLEYSNRYIGQILYTDSDNNLQNLKKNKNIKVVLKTKEELDIAKTYSMKGYIEKFNEEINYKGFNERKYYYLKKVDFKFVLDEKHTFDNRTYIISVPKNKQDKIFDYINLTKEFINQKIDEYIDNKDIFKALLLGNSKELDDEIKLNFKSTNIYHILAMSGTHISYLVLLLNVFFNKLKIKISFKIKKIIQIVILLLYMLLVGMTTSISRAVFLVLIMIIFKEFNIKYGFLNSIIFSVFLIFFINPYTVYDIAFYLSYCSAISIFMFLRIEENLRVFRNISTFLKTTINKNHLNIKKGNKTVKVNKKGKTKKEIFLDYLEKLIKFIFYNIYISVVVYFSLLPLVLYFFNEITLNFILANLLISVILPFLMILGFLFVFLLLLFYKISKLNYLTIILEYIIKSILISLAKVIDFLLRVLLLFTEKLSLLNKRFNLIYYIKSPSIFLIFSFYIILFLFFYFFSTNTSQFISTKKYILKRYIKVKKIIIRRKILIVLLILVFISHNLYTYFLINNGKLKLAFISVGQGDSSFIISACRTTVLVDTGSNTIFDNGGEIRRYIFARKENKINHLFISHFDTDHIGGTYTLINSNMVEKIYIPKYVGGFLKMEIQKKLIMSDEKVIKELESKISKGGIDLQSESYLNYYNLIKAAKEKSIPVIELERGNIIDLDKNTKVEVLFPVKDFIKTNVINNNSLVFKLTATTDNNSKISILYTGDIEKEAIKVLIDLDNKEKNIVDLKSDIIKVPHHGSKNSVVFEFYQKVNPKIFIISAGKNNIYGHPHKEVLEMISNIKGKVFRTDLEGEIFLDENTILNY